MTPLSRYFAMFSVSTVQFSQMTRKRLYYAISVLSKIPPLPRAPRFYLVDCLSSLSEYTVFTRWKEEFVFPTGIYRIYPILTTLFFFHDLDARREGLLRSEKVKLIPPPRHFFRGRVWTRLARGRMFYFANIQKKCRYRQWTHNLHLILNHPHCHSTPLCRLVQRIPQQVAFCCNCKLHKLLGHNVNSGTLPRV